jgi:hypothetical protein
MAMKITLKRELNIKRHKKQTGITDMTGTYLIQYSHNLMYFAHLGSCLSSR